MEIDIIYLYYNIVIHSASNQLLNSLRLFPLIQYIQSRSSRAHEKQIFYSTVRRIAIRYIREILSVYILGT